MLETRSLTVNVPAPKVTSPVSESVSPLVRLMAPLAAAMIVPWQLTGSAIVPHPPNPCPVPRQCRAQNVREAGGIGITQEGRGRIEARGHDHQRVGADRERRGSGIDDAAGEVDDDPAAGHDRGRAAAAVQGPAGRLQADAKLEQSAAEHIATAQTTATQIDVSGHVGSARLLEEGFRALNLLDGCLDRPLPLR